MPAAKTSRSRTTPKRTASREPAALRRLNKSLDSAQEALAALGKDVGKDMGGGAKDLQKNVTRFVKDARRDSGKLGKALQRDIERLQKRLATTGRSSRRTTGRKAASRPTRSSARSTRSKSTARRKPAARGRRR